MSPLIIVSLFLILVWASLFFWLFMNHPRSSEFGYFYPLYLPFIVFKLYIYLAKSRLGSLSKIIVRMSVICHCLSSFPPLLSFYSFGRLQVFKWLLGKEKKRLSTYLMVLFRLLFHLKVRIIYHFIFYLLNLIFWLSNDSNLL